jgi:hypothetical protein
MHLAGRRLLVFQKPAYCPVKGLCKNPGLFIVECTVNMLERRDKGAEFSKGVPAQMAFLEKLLDMLGSLAACPGLKQPPAVHKRYN